MRPRLHPSTRKLRRWLGLEGDELPPDHGVDAHVATCDRCATRLEELAQPVPLLSSALAATLQAPDDLVQRLGIRMTQTIRDQEDLRLFLDLLGIPFDTFRNLMKENPDE